jgi:hypothetical protein
MENTSAERYGNFRRQRSLALKIRLVCLFIYAPITDETTLPYRAASFSDGR